MGIEADFNQKSWDLAIKSKDLMRFFRGLYIYPIRNLT